MFLRRALINYVILRIKPLPIIVIFLFLMVENKPTDLFHGHPLPAWICEPHTARILDVNQAAVAAFGYTRQQSLGICLHDILREQERPYEVHTACVMHEDKNCWL